MRLIIELISVVILTAALIMALTGWHSDHLRLRLETKREANLPQLLRNEDTTTVTLNQQHAQDISSMQQLRYDLNQATGEVKNLTANLKTTQASLTNQQRDYTDLLAQFNDLRDREAKISLDESQYFEMYTQSNQATVDQREYIKGLYLDDLTLRKAEKEAPYNAVVSLTGSKSTVPQTKAASPSNLQDSAVSSSTAFPKEVPATPP